MVTIVMLTVIKTDCSLKYVKNSLVSGYSVICEKYIVIVTVGLLRFVVNIHFYEYTIFLS